VAAAQREVDDRPAPRQHAARAFDASAVWWLIWFRNVGLDQLRLR
jgi:hypothetical protein